MTDTPLAADAPLSAATSRPTDAPDVPLSDPASFDLDAWAAGLRPSRRAVTVYARPDLQADADILRERALEARRAGDAEAAESYQADLRRVINVLRASSLDIIVQATSPDTQDAIKASTGAAAGEDMSFDQALHYTAAHVVEPSGFTAEHLRALSDASPAQAMLVVHAVRKANVEAPRVDGPFSRGR